jgi:NADH dehydrogenase
MQDQRPRVVIVGGGFGGVAAARRLKGANVDVVLIDRRNHNIFQPLLYQVATAVLAPSDVAAPIRQLARGQPNLTVLMGEVSGIDLSDRTITTTCVDGPEFKQRFDYLVIAAGMRPSYFGHDEFAAHAPSLKTISDAEAIRTKILTAFELAELTSDPAEVARQMTFVLVGAGPTGVELAASIAQMTTVTLRSNFRKIDPAKTTILLLEGGKRILPSFHESLSERAARHLARIGVDVRTGTLVEDITERGVIVGGKLIESATVLWTAGVEPAPIIKSLPFKSDRAGRICVGPSLEPPGISGVFVIGDACTISQDGRPLPGVAQVAIQQGDFVGRAIAAQATGRKLVKPFRYFDKGNMAVVGKNFAVMETSSICLSGFVSYLAWALIHVMFLPQVQNRMRVQTQWLWTYFTGQRGSRIIGERAAVRASGKAVQK